MSSVSPKWSDHTVVWESLELHLSWRKGLPIGWWSHFNPHSDFTEGKTETPRSYICPRSHGASEFLNHNLRTFWVFCPGFCPINKQRKKSEHESRKRKKKSIHYLSSFFSHLISDCRNKNLQTIWSLKMYRSIKKKRKITYYILTTYNKYCHYILHISFWIYTRYTRVDMCSYTCTHMHTRATTPCTICFTASIASFFSTYQHIVFSHITGIFRKCHL